MKLGSETIVLYVLRNYWEKVKDFLDPTGLYYPKNPILCGHIFEVVMRTMIKIGGDFDVFDSERNSEILKINRASKCDSKGIGPGKQMEFIVECGKLPLTSASGYSRQLYISNSTNQPVVDMMDAVDRGYQVTTANSYSLNLFWLQRMIYAFHPNVTDKNPLKIYYVILATKHDNFRIHEESSYSFEEFFIHLLQRSGRNEEEINNIINTLPSKNNKTERGQEIVKKMKMFFPNHNLDDEMNRLNNCYQKFIIPISLEMMKKSESQMSAFIDDLVKSNLHIKE